MSEKNEENVLKNIILRLTFNPTKEIQISSSENIIHYERTNERMLNDPSRVSSHFHGVFVSNHINHSLRN